MNRDTRKLQHTKTKTIEVVDRIPTDSEGSSGDVRVCRTNDGVKLFVKYKNKWYGNVVSVHKKETVFISVEVDDWTITQEGTSLVFKYQGTEKWRVTV